MKLFSKLFKTRSESVASLPEQKSAISDNEETFETIISLAKQSNSGKDVLKIWEIVLNLKEWIFITTDTENIQENQPAHFRPFIGVVEQTPWLFMFTTAEKALEYAKNESRFSNKDGETKIINMPVNNALDIIFKLETQGIYGIMINENDRNINANFNIPIPVLKQILQLLNRNIENEDKK